ncbi:MAG: tRNA pseudouridine(55) synthase TruB [Megasphaera sp.]|jgi:tRNA pseudouridine55 synthase|nr:tRNA pseudouridine(55) synthase TruB [Megasphaera sp.]MCI1247796.1 tRNA pseudouridine(55) synthase TruB [Megasphaera sp.]
MINGIVNVLKPTGMSSHDVVGQLRRIYHMKKVGHAGTLDPLAAGVLPVYLGQATRLIEYGDSNIKQYRAEFTLGLATDTEDSTGEVVAAAPLPELSVEDIKTALEMFHGEIEQRPSRYSAININGVKAYKLARQHADFTLPGRQVTIYDIRLLSYDAGCGVFDVTCSQGTYVRSLIRDLGEALGTYGCMTYLVRIKAGLFDIDEAATLEEIEAEPMRYVLSVDTAIQELRKVTLPAAGCASLLQGRPVPFAGKGLPPDVVLRIYNPEDKLAGIARFDKEHHVIRPHKMFADVL